MDNSEIRIRELKVFAYHGVYPSEQEEGQNFYVNATLWQDTSAAAANDELALSTNYGEVCLFIRDWMKENTFRLLETVCEKLAEAILKTFPLIGEIELEVRKPEAPIPMEFESVSVCIRRGWHTAYLSVGSNMGDSRGYLENAIKTLGSKPHTQVLKMSEMVITKPYGGVEQDDFLNAAIKLRTLLSPRKLLDFLHEIENAAGRRRTVRWGPRTLDLDIIFYDDLVCEDDDLIIPHADMENREFVLNPLSEIAPNFRHPVLQKTVKCLAAELRLANSGEIK